jgi:pilus assembly protein Flp/PilA
VELRWVKRFYQDDSGASAVEYSIILSFIAIAIIGAVAAFGSSVSGLFAKGAESLNK